MNRVLKALGYATIALTYHTIQTTRNNKTVSLGYTMGVEDGLNMAKDFDRVKSRQMESDMTKTKYARYAKIVEGE